MVRGPTDRLESILEPTVEKGMGWWFERSKEVDREVERGRERATHKHTGTQAKIHTQTHTDT